MGLIESGNMVNDTHSPHFRPNRFQQAGGEIILFTKRTKKRDKLVFGVFQFDEDGQENLLVLSVPREQQGCELIQTLDPGNFVAAELDLCAWHSYHPPFLA